MSYLEISWEYRPSKTGIRDGVPPAWFSKDVWYLCPGLKELMSGSDVSKYICGIMPDYEIKLDWLELDPAAKLTDFIHVGGLLGYVVNERVRTLLKDFHLPPHTFYPVICRQFNRKTKETREIHEYSWFYFNLEIGEKNVDFAESVFDDYQHKNRYPDRDFSVASYQQYESHIARTPPAMKARKLVFNPSFDKELDFWGTRFLSTANYISQRLHDAFVRAGVSGYVVYPPRCELIFK